MSKEKIYVGGGEEKFDGDVINICINLSELPEEYMFDGKKGKYIKLDVCKRQAVGEYGDTHYVKVDTWKPEQKQEAKEEEDSLPF